VELAALTRLLRLSSPSLPIGGYSYSQGLEAVLATGGASASAEVERWIGDHLALVLARNDAAYWWRLALAWGAGDLAAAATWNAEFLASRDGAEPRAETVQMGYSLTRLLEELEGDAASPLLALEPPTFPAAHAFAATLWRLPPREALAAYLWAWLEAQVLAYLKLGGAGQVAGQRILGRLAAHIPRIVDESEAIEDDDISSFAPALALTSYAHEVQDGRLFRS
jgi:urease accessory protein